MLESSIGILQVRALQLCCNCRAQAMGTENLCPHSRRVCSLSEHVPQDQVVPRRTDVKSSEKEFSKNQVTMT